MDNYEISANQAKKLFLKYDQPTMIRKFSLDYDGEFLYLVFAGEKYRISRLSGEVFRPDGADILKILRYETLFYVEGWLCERILSLCDA